MSDKEPNSPGKQWVSFDANGDTSGLAEASEKDVDDLNKSSTAAEIGINLSKDHVGESDTDLDNSPRGAVIDATQIEMKVGKTSASSSGMPENSDVAQPKIVPPPRPVNKSPTKVATDPAGPGVGNNSEAKENVTAMVNNNQRHLKSNGATGIDTSTSLGSITDMTLHPIPLDTKISEENFENGQLLASLSPVNQNWAWITAAKFDPESVPPELLTPNLSITADDYTMCMDFLTNDYRFCCYTVCYRRLIICWLIFCFLILLGLLFSGEKGIVLFGIGICWLIVIACGIIASLYMKAKINKNLEVAVASVNRILMKHKILVGMEDAGKVSCHKIYLHFIYYDCAPCLAWIEQEIAEKRKKAQRKHKRDTHAASAEEAQKSDENKSNAVKKGDREGPSSGSVPAAATAAGGTEDVEIHVEDTVDIVDQDMDSTITQINRLEHAEHIMLRYSQVFVKNLCRDLLPLRTDIPEGLEAHRARHCPTTYCLCQYVEQNFFRLKPPKWYASFV